MLLVAMVTAMIHHLFGWSILISTEYGGRGVGRVSRWGDDEGTSEGLGVTPVHIGQWSYYTGLIHEM